jgi:hypothetical protein
MLCIAHHPVSYTRRVFAPVIYRESSHFLIGLDSVQIHGMYNLQDEQYTACITYRKSCRYSPLGSLVVSEIACNLICIKAYMICTLLLSLFIKFPFSSIISWHTPQTYLHFASPLAQTYIACLLHYILKCVFYK